MKKSVYAWSILLTLAVGMLAGFLIRDDVSFYLQSVKKPALTPPAWAFPAVWTVLYVLMAWGLARVLVRAGQRAARPRGLTRSVAQLFFNFFWSILFFHVRAYLFSLVWLAILWLLILAMARAFSRVDRAAAYLQVPYLAWVAFAGYLNLMVFPLN